MGGKKETHVQVSVLSNWIIHLLRWIKEMAVLRGKKGSGKRMDQEQW